MRLCCRCGVEKPDEGFSKDRHSPTGFTYHCKECRNKNRSTKEQGREYSLRSYEKNKQKWSERNKAWRGKNVEKLVEYRKSRGAINCVHAAKRRASEMSATPAWADEKEIQEIYKFAKEFRDAGFEVDVDHIEPLRGKNVCGLHVEQNLRVCLSSVNKSKKNKQVEYFK